MTIQPNHTCSIDNIGFYTETPDITEPYARHQYDSIEIENGPPRSYQTGITPRELTFKATLRHEDPTETINLLRECVGIRQFTSVYVGSFRAEITVKLGEFTLDSVVAAFTAKEVFI